MMRNQKLVIVKINAIEIKGNVCSVQHANWQALIFAAYDFNDGNSTKTKITKTKMKPTEMKPGSTTSYHAYSQGF